MPEDRKKKTLLQSVMPIIVPMLVVPLGWSLGTLLGLISDFGLHYTVENIRLNPDMFAKQYSWGIVYGGWIAVAVVVASAATVGIALVRRRGNAPTPDER